MIINSTPLRQGINITDRKDFNMSDTHSLKVIDEEEKENVETN